MCSSSGVYLLFYTPTPNFFAKIDIMQAIKMAADFFLGLTHRFQFPLDVNAVCNNYMVFFWVSTCYTHDFLILRSSNLQLSLLYKESRSLGCTDCLCVFPLDNQFKWVGFIDVPFQLTEIRMNMNYVALLRSNLFLSCLDMNKNVCNISYF